MHPNARRFSRMYQNAPECTRMHQTAAECTRMYQNAEECARMHQDAPRCTRMHNDAKECSRTVRMHQNGRECKRMPEDTQNAPECIFFRGARHLFCLLHHLKSFRCIHLRFFLRKLHRAVAAAEVDAVATRRGTFLVLFRALAQNDTLFC